MKDRKLFPIPNWMKFDERPMDEGEFKKYGYGYTRKVGRKELWRPATRAIIRRDKGHFRNYEIVTLYPGAYFVSDHGRVYSLFINDYLSSRRYHKRHSKMNLLNADGKIVEVYRYRLIISNFIEPPAKLRNFVYYLCDSINHVDLCSWNDRIDNIEYTTRAMNIEHEHIFMKNKKTKNRGKKCIIHNTPQMILQDG